MPSLIIKKGVLRYRASVPIPGIPGKRKQKLYPDDSKKSHKKAILWEEKTKKKLIEEMEQEAVTVFFNLGNGKGLNCLQAFLRHKNATATEKYLKSLGLKPLREGLDEGFKRPGKVIELKKLKAPGTISHGG